MNKLKMMILVLLFGSNLLGKGLLPNKEFELKSVSCPETNKAPEKNPIWKMTFLGSGYNDLYIESDFCLRTGGTHEIVDGNLNITMTSSKERGGKEYFGRTVFTNPIKNITENSFVLSRRDQVCNGVTEYKFEATRFKR